MAVNIALNASEAKEKRRRIEVYPTPVMPMYMGRPGVPHASRLAPHETLELHELLALKTTGLVKLKKSLPKITNPELKQICLQAIQTTERHIVDLMNLLQYRPMIT
jgi:predicted HTH transcriptional regulator